MRTTIYNKLVRDRIPDIIRSEGNIPHIRILGDAEYHQCLIDKIREELKEYEESGSVEELADFLEVFYSLIEHDGFGLSEIEACRQAKRERNGGFEMKLYLSSVDRKE